jgi:hypothetical protein
MSGFRCSLFFADYDAVKCKLEILNICLFTAIGDSLRNLFSLMMRALSWYIVVKEWGKYYKSH